ncbi:MAG: bifunctional glutamate N-acetyltransferase/amino-acid acetyltransferase ArgJ [Actinomycetota bacterium]
MSGSIELPQGFSAWVGNLGIKDETDDIAIVVSEVDGAAAGVFTKSRFAGPSVLRARDAVGDGKLRGTVVVSKNANVANGATGDRDATELQQLVADRIGCDAVDVAITSTGVIGRPYPMDRIRHGLGQADGLTLTTGAERVATAMMTTDTHPKVASATAGAATVVGVAKGVGMIEPDMATMLAMIYTDAEISADELDRRFRRIVDVTFNSLSVDTDTSTSDTALVLANGLAGPVDDDELEWALREVCTDLTRQLASDGEGATKLLIVDVLGGRDANQARRVAKTIVNSPLVKTAVHGADPNWGRVVMAIGKCSDDEDIDPDRVVVRFGGVEVYPRQADADVLRGLEEYLQGDEVVIAADLGIGSGTWRVYGCDLSDGYVRINADYTT